jgi:hypothetical protein
VSGYGFFHTRVWIFTRPGDFSCAFATFILLLWKNALEIIALVDEFLDSGTFGHFAQGPVLLRFCA